MGLEKTHEFEIQGCQFYILWKPGGCLLRTIESPGTDDEVHYTVSDLFIDLYDGDSYYELSKEEAIEKAPLIAATVIVKGREQEVAHMEGFYNSEDEQRKYPVYKILTATVDGRQYPLIWGSHNCNTYVKIKEKWFFSDFAKNAEEAKNKSEAYIRNKASTSYNIEGNFLSIFKKIFKKSKINKS